MLNATGVELATSIVKRWNHVLDLEWHARRGNESALRDRETSGSRTWLL